MAWALYIIFKTVEIWCMHMLYDAYVDFFLSFFLWNLIICGGHLIYFGFCALHLAPETL